MYACTCTRLCVLQGHFGPFATGVPVDVPLWVALRLREDSLCHVMPPSWMNVGTCARHARHANVHRMFRWMHVCMWDGGGCSVVVSDVSRREEQR